MRSAKVQVFAAALVALVAGAAAPEASAKKLADQFIRIEINSTDGDAGIHIFLDGVGWDSMQLKGPDGSVLFNVLAEGSVGFQGITEFFFESAEPSFDEQPLEELLELFPEGTYRFKGTTTEGKKLKGKARLTHVLPDGPALVFPVDGQAVDPDNAVFEWQAVADPPGGEIVGYEVIAGCEGEDFVDYTAEVGADVNSVTISPEILDQGGTECKWEVLAIEAGGNQTISESEFEIE
ncbi:MAG: hypothetical protein GY769_03575 [bacterium]|nr:hypothetical protein [bacterium]